MTGPPRELGKQPARLCRMLPASLAFLRLSQCRESILGSLSVRERHEETLARLRFGAAGDGVLATVPVGGDDSARGTQQCLPAARRLGVTVRV